MTEKSWLDVLELLFDLDPGAVRKRDDATREKLKKLLRSGSEADGIVGKVASLNVR